MVLLQKDEELREIVMLVGPDALSEGQRVVLEAARMIKEDFLMQHAYNPADSYCDKRKTYDMRRRIVGDDKLMQKAVDEGLPLDKIVDVPVKPEIRRLRIETADKFDDGTKAIGKKMETE